MKNSLKDGKCIGQYRGTVYLQSIRYYKDTTGLQQNILDWVWWVNHYFRSVGKTPDLLYTVGMSSH